jgi:hypothetical protein
LKITTRRERDFQNAWQVYRIDADILFFFKTQIAAYTNCCNQLQEKVTLKQGSNEKT